MLQDFLPADRPDLMNIAVAVVEAFNEQELPHSEAATVSLAIFAAVAKAHPCCTESCANAAHNVANYLRFRASKAEPSAASDSSRVAADAERFARGVPEQDQSRLSQSVRETHEYLIAKGMPLWQYFDTLVSLYVSAVEAHPDQRNAAHLFGQRLQHMFPVQPAAATVAAGSSLTH